MRYLLDTNVVSELRRGKRMNASVRAWIDGTDDASLCVSALTVGELHRGAERILRRDPKVGEPLLLWVQSMEERFRGRIMPVDAEIARTWARLSVPDPLPFVDGFLAATAIVHDFTLVTRDTRGVARTGVRLLDPFAVPTPPASGEGVGG